MEQKLPNLALSEFVHNKLTDNCYTPDMHDICKKYRYVPVFLYCTHKFQFSDYGVLGSCPRFGVGMTQSANYMMYIYNSGLPVVLPRIDVRNSGRIQGEIFLVTPDILFKLDKEFQNTVFFKRHQRTIMWKPPEQKEDRYQMSDCFMYIGSVNKWEDDIKTGKLKLKDPVVSLTNSAQGPYYMFTAHDDFNTV